MIRRTNATLLMTTNNNIKSFQYFRFLNFLYGALIFVLLLLMGGAVSILMKRRQENDIVLRRDSFEREVTKLTLKAEDKAPGSKADQDAQEYD